MTHLAVSITVHSLEQAHAAAAVAAERGADLVEYRVDGFTDQASAVATLVEQSPLPCIITCRPVWEGGDYDGDETDRVSLLEHVGTTASPLYFDFELAAFNRSANLRQKVLLIVDHPAQVRACDAGLILSSHDFDQRPADLLQRIESMANAPACRVIKVAWRARSLRDNLEAFELLLARHKPTIALCMGEFGLPSRVLAKKFGALLTFAALDAHQATAPGQPTVDELKSLYRWDALQPSTQVYGVIGHPVSHSMSPAIHNAGFEAAGFDGVYLPMPIAPGYEPFKATVDAWLNMPELHFRGASVTIPHKQNLLRFVEEMGGEIEPLAARIGAANTLTVRDDGSLYASNTDYAAALDAVVDAMGINRSDLLGKKVAVVGAGGAARAVVAGFAEHGAKVFLHNRTIEKAQALAEEFADLPGEIIAKPADDICDSCCDVFINCTPLGMHPNTDTTPMPVGVLKEGGKGWGPDKLVFDTVYNPVQTKLLQDARSAGCKTVTGVEMFVRQGAAQFELWTGQNAPRDVFERVILDHLGQ